MYCPRQKLIISSSGFLQFIHALIFALPYLVVIYQFIPVFSTRLLILDLGDGPLIFWCPAPDTGMPHSTCSINIRFLLSENLFIKVSIK